MSPIFSCVTAGVQELAVIFLGARWRNLVRVQCLQMRVQCLKNL